MLGKLEANEIKFDASSNDISVKTASTSVFLDGANSVKHFTDYQFLKRTKLEVVKPVASVSPKKNLKKKVEAANI